MSDEYGYEEYTENIGNAGESGGIKALREKAESDSKRIQELSDKLARLEEQSRQASVTDLFKAQGVNPKAAKFYRGDPNPEKVSEWLTENSELFGARQDEENSTHEEAGSTPSNVPPVVSFEDQQAYLRMQNAQIDGTPSSNYADQAADLNKATTTEELLAAMQKHGWTNGF